MERPRGPKAFVLDLYHISSYKTSHLYNHSMNINFIGLGNMGSGMVFNLIEAGHSVIAYDTDATKREEAKKLGATIVTNLPELTDTAEVTILCLPHPDISEQVLAELLHYTGTMHTYIDTSTLSPQKAELLFRKVKENGKQFLCAPMLGGKPHAANGTIHFLVEGDEGIFERYQSLFLAMGDRVDYMGVPPKATVTKLAYNICRYGNIALAAVVSRFVRESVDNTQAVFDLLAEGSLDNFGQVWQEDMKEMMLTGKSYTPSHIPEKDLSFIKDLVSSDAKMIEAIIDVYKTLPKK